MAPKYMLKKSTSSLSEKIRERGFLKSSSHSSSSPAQQVVVMRFYNAYFLSLGEQIKIFDITSLQAQKRNNKLVDLHNRPSSLKSCMAGRVIILIDPCLIPGKNGREKTIKTHNA
jgi:hypothetical protein